MMECKKALVEADGDMEKAIDYLRERGLAAAQKKATRIAAEGVVAAVANDYALVDQIVVDALCISHLCQKEISICLKNLLASGQFGECLYQTRPLL